MRQLIVLLCLLSFLPSALAMERIGVTGVREKQREIDWNGGGGGGSSGGDFSGRGEGTSSNQPMTAE